MSQWAVALGGLACVGVIVGISRLNSQASHADVKEAVEIVQPLEYPVDREQWDANWSKGLADMELNLQRHGQGWRPFDREQMLAPSLRHFLDLPTEIVDNSITMFWVLVAASGPGSPIGYKSWPDAEVTLVLSDPLAYGYQALCRKYQVFPPLNIMPVRTEELSEVFQVESFDLVYAANALKRMRDPTRSFQEMVAVTGPCRWVIIDITDESPEVGEQEDPASSGDNIWGLRLDFTGYPQLVRGAEESVNVTEAMLAAGAIEVHVQRWAGCHLSQLCEFPEQRQLRLSIRRGPGPGSHCPSFRGPAQR